MSEKILIDKKDLITKKDIEEIAITGQFGSCLSWLNNPFCWFEDALPKQRNVFRKMARQMNVIRKTNGLKPIVKESK